MLVAEENPARVRPRVKRLHRLGTALALALLPLSALSPLLAPGLFSTPDGLFHIFRAVALEAALREGNLYPRWAPDFVQGLGYPIFNFYAPLANYLQVALHWLGLANVEALKAATALAFVGSGATMYVFARDLLGHRGALLAAAAYVYAPLMFTEAYVRGDLPEHLALALLPLVLWALRRLVDRPTVGRLALGGLLYATLVVTHNLVGFFGSPLLALYAVALVVWGRRWRALPFVVAALALGLGLSAFFWLPALGEKEWVQIGRLIDGPSWDFRLHFGTFAELFGLEMPIDVSQGNAQPGAYRLGLGQVLLAGLGLAALAPGRPR